MNDPDSNFNAVQREHAAAFERAMVAQHIETASVRLALALEALRDTAFHHGLDEAGAWLDSSKCAALGAAKELREERDV